MRSQSLRNVIRMARSFWCPNLDNAVVALWLVAERAVTDDIEVRNNTPELRFEALADGRLVGEIRYCREPGHVLTDPSVRRSQYA
jgi:hypothetical protein